ncbi:P protein-like [Sitodiplosis mosellana]|uniref:P protein-like n=1 Tax=Sitodiplosis mosellana TaxID=263140 RepID=UPI002443DAF6|nr:P protein-like [Sitodiplosis mosellana]XP_055303076.1 P protein-like [Sitodiplosis mosellana]XP_055303077.1 P protein-like [Sitodiplosis mosellana]XP_055303078.1 P protein-like [Sitodiplosis mosellana]XP_055303079.1 P protein-like [Sitodiplosis mosellana]
MGRSKRLQSPHRKNSTTKSYHTKSVQRRRSLLTLISPDDVTEGTLQVWRSLPSKIRQDPSLAPFQVEHERVNGSTSNEPVAGGSNECMENDDEDKIESNSIHIHVTNTDGIDNHLEEISTTYTVKGSSLTNITNASHSTRSTSSLKNSGSPFHKHPKVIFLFALWFCSMAFMTTEYEKKSHQKLLSIDDTQTKSYRLPKIYYGEQIILGLEGPFLQDTNDSMHQVTVRLMSGSRPIDMIGYEWNIPIADPDQVDYTSLKTFRRTYSIDHNIYTRQKRLEVLLRKNTPEGLTVNLHFNPTPVDIHVGAVCAGLVLLMFYVLIIYEIVHRTFAAILSSIMAIGLLSVLNDRPDLKEIVQWMNCETLLLLFSMMILVAILTETGIFNYIAVYAFEKTNGRIWPLIFSLCFITAVLSAFLHSVTTILLMTPVTIKLCECLGLNPVPILIAVILNGNIGAAATPLGHVPNLMITGNAVFSNKGVTFISYTVHMTVGVVLAFIQTCFYLRWMYKDMHELRTKEPQEVTDLRREIVVWERTAASLSTLTRESQVVRDTLMKKVAILQSKLKKTVSSEKSVPNETYRQTLEELQKSYPIKNAKLLVKSGIVLIFIIAMFFLQSIPEYEKLSIAWCALIGVMFLLIIAEKDDMDALMHRIEWTTLLFFAAMFVTLECLERLRLLHWFNEQTINLISTFDDANVRLAFAIVIVIWLSGLLSALIDSIPVTAMMIKIVILIAENESLNLPVQPLVWAVAFGPCLGGNGTLYGASANILCAGIAEQHGYKISFSKYFRRSFPIMIASLITITGYLIVAHVIFQWHTA